MTNRKNRPPIPSPPPQPLMLLLLLLLIVLLQCAGVWRLIAVVEGTNPTATEGSSSTTATTPTPPKHNGCTPAEEAEIRALICGLPGPDGWWVFYFIFSKRSFLRPQSCLKNVRGLSEVQILWLL